MVLYSQNCDDGEQPSVHCICCIWSLISQNDMGNDGCCSGGLWINFDHQGFFSVRRHCAVYMHLAFRLHQNTATADGIERKFPVLGSQAP